MAFRANEAEQDGFERAKRYLCSPKNLQPSDVEAGKRLLADIVDKWGPVIQGYPSWHPLVASGKRDHSSVEIVPGESCGYQGLDHSIYLRNAFITCPYRDCERVIDSVRAIPYPDYVTVNAEKLDSKLYHPGATPVLVTCEWHSQSQQDQTISQRFAIGAMLDEELACWKNAQVAETWDTMRPLFLGQPCGSKSSLFVNQKTGLTMKKVWEAIIQAGVYGPIKMDR